MTALEKTIRDAQFARLSPDQQSALLAALRRLLAARYAKRPPAVVRARKLGVRCCETSEN